MDVTLSAKSVLLVQHSFDQNKFISEVNDSLSGISPVDEESLPEITIPKDLIFRSPISKIRGLASSISNQLSDFKDENNIRDDEILSAFLNTNFNFSNQVQYFPDEPDFNGSLLSLIQRRFSNVELPSQTHPANDVIYSIRLFSVKRKKVQIKTQLQQWFVAFGSNTISSLIDMIICPLCELSKRISVNHLQPPMLDNGEQIIFGFGDGFNVPISTFSNAMNRHIKYTSPGGCFHALLFDAAFAVHVSDYSGFPKEIGGKGVNPPNCMKCLHKVAPICVRKETKGFEFLCKDCFQNDESSNGNEFTVDLSDFFFRHYKKL
ncbi:hypothetical protein GPJ56_003629 [Histomonas meleagridis]|uniref:uncharacterized protein n=1 Tax=Histomonas meleagridis TaxID=135588 RepID=UPI00355A8248|nr:hypothetical protein GPJ56_003629 [Histomonas meleagridis]KAH0800699.1 hypothetical protein GO595_006452 [Histomonas meleagridis]